MAVGNKNKDFPKWKYICKAWDAGEDRDHYEEEMELIEELQIPKEKIVFLAGSWSRDFMPYVISAADIYAAPSRLEGCGMIQVEAQACGVPVISIDAMGPKETVVYGETGFLARVDHTIDLESELVDEDKGFKRQGRIVFDEPKTFAYRADVGELAEYTLALLSNDAVRQRMGERAVQHARDNFQYQFLAKRCVEILRETFSI